MKINKKVCLYCGKPIEGERLFICEQCEKSTQNVVFNDIKAIWFLLGLFLGTIKCEAFTDEELEILGRQTPINNIGSMIDLINRERE